MGIIVGANIKEYPVGHPVFVDSQQILYYPDGFQKAPAYFHAKGICRIHNSVPRPDSARHLLAMIPDDNISGLPPNMSLHPFGYRIMFVPEEDCRVYCEMN